MELVIGNVALATEETPATSPKSSAQKEVDMVQINYICKLFEKAMKMGCTDRTGMEPLLIKRQSVRLNNGYGDLVEIRGYFTQKVVESAIFKLQDSGNLKKWSEDALTEFVTDDMGNVVSINFMRPSFRMRLT